MTLSRYVSRLLLCGALLLPAALLQAQTDPQADAPSAPQLRQDAPASFAEARQAELARDRARLAELVDDRDALRDAVEAARERREAAAERRQDLEAQRDEQQARREALAERQQAQGGELSDVEPVLERHVGELRDALGQSWLTLNGAELPARGEADTLPDLPRLESLADALMALTRETGRIERLTVPVASVDGRVAPREVLRLGDLAMIEGGRWLRRDSPDLPPAALAATPDDASETLAAFARGESDRVTLDPTGGELLEALAQRPDLLARFHQGGAVGYVVVALGGLGLLIALGQYGYLMRVSARLRRQLRDGANLRDDNPLGRVLAKVQTLRQGLVPEALEARLDEALLAELPRLERGQALVKLLAAVAPLLGLLGTVTGMIGTFQSITVFGTGDPQLMAGGISQALVTTVLGLITAVPLMLAHTTLASRSRWLSGVIEGHASAALAEHLEALPASSAQHRESRHAAALA
ncbi:MotA/TolQ/ExbB proton channel family protein [Halomonas saccharevitans]|uniref:Biopolymer transport protein ExbB n=1 Tax=Halomonas saccharevitans TaxID=416872 RepID=A0A1I6X4L9_9GAMM|nr:MotA/TolQ/ExbB proton channel family protein [Halomonas saccharevitans]SFT33233.1 biopolymer transport protein ExbB [Halomonas saccharevitans]